MSHNDHSFCAKKFGKHESFFICTYGFMALGNHMIR